MAKLAWAIVVVLAAFCGLMAFTFRIPLPAHKIIPNTNVIPTSPEGAAAVYDLIGIKAPTLCGWAFHALVVVAEQWPVAQLLPWSALQNSKIQDVRALSAEIALPITVYPLYEAEEGQFGDDDQTTVGAAAFLEQPHRMTEEIDEALGDGFRFWTIDDYADAYRLGTTTPEVVAAAVVENMAVLDNRERPIRAMIDYHVEEIMRDAEASALRFQNGFPLSILDGVPVAVKDELFVKGYRTWSGTLFIGADIPTADATIVHRLRALGAIIIGKTNMQEIGIGVTGHNQHWGVARNPYDDTRYTGGSSSGTAAAVASGLVPLGLGADGGGSIRIPSALNGIVGVKATFGRISEHGAEPICWSVVHAGPMAASVRDAAIAYAAMAGYDPHDHVTVGQPPVLLPSPDTETDVKGLKAGIFWPWFEDATPAVVAGCKAAVKRLEARGMEVVAIQIPHLNAMSKAHLISILGEMATTMDGKMAVNRTLFSLDSRAALNTASALSAVDYVAAQEVRTFFKSIIDNVFENVDVMLTPSTGMTAPLVREYKEGCFNAVLTGEIMRFAALGNFIGNPAFSVNVGYDDGNLPIGLQIIGRHWEEHVLFRVAAAAELDAPRSKPMVFVDNLA